MATRIEKNLLLAGLMRATGLAACPMMISTRTHGRLDTKNPKIFSFNYLIVRLNLAGNLQYLDTRYEYYPYGLLPYSDHVDIGFLIDTDCAELKPIPAPHNVSMAHAMTEVQLDPRGCLKAQSTLRFEGYRGVQYRRKCDQYDELDKFIEQDILDGLSEVSIDSFVIINRECCDVPLTVKVLYQMDNFARVIDGKIYFNPVLLQKIAENPFNLEDRNFPVEYPYPRINTEEVTYTLPKGYTVSEVPE